MQIFSSFFTFFNFSPQELVAAFFLGGSVLFYTVIMVAVCRFLTKDNAAHKND